MSQEKQNEKKMDRRSALKKLGGITAGAVLGGYSLKNSFSAQASNNNQDSETTWPYSELDVEYVRKLGHEGYKLGNCGSASFYAIMKALKEEIGQPYTEIQVTPPNMMHFGGAGMGRYLCCGSLLGSFAAVNAVAEPETANQIRDELFEWYENASLPTDKANQYAKNNEFFVNDYDKEIIQTVAGSPMCEDSVANWIGTARIPFEDSLRGERCSRVAGDTAAKTAELLNKYL